MKRKMILPLYGLIFIFCGCSRKSFNENLLNENRDRIAPISQRECIKYYDDANPRYYLLTIYKTFEKAPGEDFSFEGVNTFKKNKEVDLSMVSENNFIEVQFLALYFFKNGGVIYHAPYEIKKKGYKPINIKNFEDFYKIKNTWKKFGDLMHGYISKPINPNLINQTTNNTVNKTKKDSAFNSKEQSYGKIATQRNAKGDEMEDYLRLLLADESIDPCMLRNPKDSVQRIYLERRGKTASIKDAIAKVDKKVYEDSHKVYLKAFEAINKSSSAEEIDVIVDDVEKERYKIEVKKEAEYKKIQRNGPNSMIVLTKHISHSTKNNEAMIFEQINYIKEINSTDAVYTQALIEKVFNFGTANNDETIAKLWFRLQPEQPRETKK